MKYKRYTVVVTRGPTVGPTVTMSVCYRESYLVLMQGGYNLTSIAESMAACVQVLLGDGLPLLKETSVPNDE